MQPPARCKNRESVAGHSLLPIEGSLGADTDNLIEWARTVSVEEKQTVRATINADLADAFGDLLSLDKVFLERSRKKLVKLLRLGRKERGRLKQFPGPLTRLHIGCCAVRLVVAGCVGCRRKVVESFLEVS